MGRYENDTPVDKALEHVREAWMTEVRAHYSDPDIGGRVTFHPAPTSRAAVWRITYEVTHAGKEADHTAVYDLRDRGGDGRGESEYLASRIRTSLPKAKKYVFGGVRRL